MMDSENLLAFKERRSRLLALARGLGCDGALLCAAAYVNVAQEAGVARIFVSKSVNSAFCSDIELSRLAHEEIDEGIPLGLTGHPWHEDPFKIIRDRIKNRPVLCDLPAPLPAAKAAGPEISALHFPLTGPEMKAYRALGRDAAAALETAARSLKAGMTEWAAAGRVSLECRKKGIVPVVNLTAFDGRIEAYRHPLPKNNALKKTAMLVVCGRRGGLIANCTRMVSLGPPSSDLKKRHRAVCAVDAAMNGALRPGAMVADAFKAGLAAYQTAGFPDEWRRHHQGGPTGYRTRYFLANAKSQTPVVPGSAWAWNPSITGTKHENTWLLGPDGLECLTRTGRWPILKIDSGGKTWEQDDILVLA